jgi:hypothetical protein
MERRAHLVAHPVATIVVGLGAIVLAVVIVRLVGIAILWRLLGQLTP